MQFELEKAIPILERTPRVLRLFLEDLPTEWIHSNEGENSWSPYDIIGHFIHGEKTDWIERTKIILNGSKTFQPFDRFAQFENSKGKSLNQLLDEFEQLRADNLKELASLQLTSDSFTLEGVHPEFGTVTLQQLLATWVTHDLGHIAQIARVIAKQYKEEVGPWLAYIPILNK